jgi:hypothetical protein
MLELDVFLITESCNYFCRRIVHLNDKGARIASVCKLLVPATGTFKVDSQVHE